MRSISDPMPVYRNKRGGLNKMYSLNIKKIIGTFTLGAAVVLSTGLLASAQNNDNWGHNQDRRSIKQQQKAARQRAKLEQERLRAEQARLRAEQIRQQRYNRNNGYNQNNNGYGNNGSYNTNGRYRVMRNGAYYNTDGRGAELLRQAVNQGYQQGYAEGQNDRSGRRRSSYSTSNVYRSGDYGYSSGVDFHRGLHNRLAASIPGSPRGALGRTLDGRAAPASGRYLHCSYRAGAWNSTCLSSGAAERRRTGNLEFFRRCAPFRRSLPGSQVDERSTTSLPIKQ